MKRTDIVMTEKLRSFLAFDLGHMDERLFPHCRADLRYSDDPGLLLDLYYPQEPRETYPVFLLIFGENLFPPIPSEVILPLAGVAAAGPNNSYWVMLLASVAGSVVGAWVLYGLGRLLGGIWRSFKR